MTSTVAMISGNTWRASSIQAEAGIQNPVVVKDMSN